MKKTLIIVLIITSSMMALAQERKYDVKSGVVKNVSTVLGQKTESILYFDNYGQLEYSTVRQAQNGTDETEISVISKDGRMYMINHQYKLIQEVDIPESINYLNLTTEMVDKYKIEIIGEEQILGKDCIKYSAEFSQMDQIASLTIWVWKGIPLKTITSSNGIDVIVESVEIHTDKWIDPEIFTLPKF